MNNEKLNFKCLPHVTKTFRYTTTTACCMRCVVALAAVRKTLQQLTKIKAVLNISSQSLT